MRILIVEDEKRIADFIARGLKEEHYAVISLMMGKRVYIWLKSIRMI